MKVWVVRILNRPRRRQRKEHVLIGDNPDALAEMAGFGILGFEKRGDRAGEMGEKILLERERFGEGIHWTQQYQKDGEKNPWRGRLALALAAIAAYARARCPRH